MTASKPLLDRQNIVTLYHRGIKMKIYCLFLLTVILIAVNIAAQTIDPTDWTLSFVEEFESLSVAAHGPCGTGGTT